MRKTTIILVVVLILTLGGTCFAAGKIYDSRDEVTLTQMTSWGEKEVIDNLMLRMNTMYRDRVHWMTTAPMKNPKEAVTEYDFSITPVYADLDRKTGLNMDVSIDTSMIQNNISLGKTEGVVKAYKELADTIGPKEEAEKEIYLKDYLIRI